MGTQIEPNQVLSHLARRDGPLLTSEVFPTIAFNTVKSTLDTLKSRDMIVYAQIEREEAHLTDEARAIVQDGSHEARVFEAVKAAVEGLRIDDLPVGQLYSGVVTTQKLTMPFRPLWAKIAQAWARARR